MMVKALKSLQARLWGLGPIVTDPVAMLNVGRWSNNR